MMLQTVVICATGYPILIRHPGAELDPEREAVSVARGQR
jgi:hypothetical protein